MPEISVDTCDSLSENLAHPTNVEFVIIVSKN